MRTTITLPVELSQFLDSDRKAMNHARSGYIGMLIKKHREGVISNMTRRKNIINKNSRGHTTSDTRCNSTLKTA